MTENQTSQEETENQENTENTQEETENTEGTQEENQEEVNAEDYASESEAKEVDYKEKFSASSREAQRLAEELKAKQKEIDDWVEFVKADPELSEAVSKKSGKVIGGDDRLDKLENELASFKKQQKESTIRAFEGGKRKEGFTFTPDLRKQIGVIAATLEKSMSYDEALELAFIKLNKQGITKKAMEAGKNQAFAQQKANQDATYSTSNSSTSNSKSYKLTKEEQAYVESMPGTAEDKQKFIEFHLSNKQRT